MPELPEVEVVKKSLENKLKNLSIKRVNISNNKLRYEINSKQFYKIRGHKIISIQRRSKYLLINLDRNYTILVHLGMTGKFLIIDIDKKYKTSFYYSLKKDDTKHDHLTFFFNKKIQLVYNDVRKFGFLKIFPSKEVHKCRHLVSLGPEPLSTDFMYLLTHSSKLLCPNNFFSNL